MTSDPNSPTVVYSAVNPIEAAAVATALEAEGIETTTTGSYTSGFQAEAPGEIQVVVRQSQAEKARAILERLEEEAEMENDDASEVDYGDEEDE
ncbi:MAG: DUF2007 domain-containing protein [Planctomycetaceae bacterium]|nr:DUF2007 domain-containing protein [Planctomycetales bacterium]MCB9937060.1 DUF2007 domain-containing protein [Planctomycetaceae bacterium]